MTTPKQEFNPPKFRELTLQLAAACCNEPDANEVKLERLLYFADMSAAVR